MRFQMPDFNPSQMMSSMAEAIGNIPTRISNFIDGLKGNFEHVDRSEVDLSKEANTSKTPIHTKAVLPEDLAMLLDLTGDQPLKTEEEQELQAITCKARDSLMEEINNACPEGKDQKDWLAAELMDPKSGVAGKVLTYLETSGGTRENLGPELKFMRLLNELAQENCSTNRVKQIQKELIKLVAMKNSEGVHAQQRIPGLAAIGETAISDFSQKEILAITMASRFQVTQALANEWLK